MANDRTVAFHISDGDTPGTFDVGFVDEDDRFEGVEVTLDELRRMRDGFNTAIRIAEGN